MEQTSARSSPIGVFGAAPWLALALGLAATTAAALYIRAAGQAEERLRLEVDVRRTVDRITDRLKAYEAALDAAGAWFATNEGADAARFRAYVERLNLTDQYPGIHAIGFSRRLGPTDRDAVVSARRAEGHPEFRIWPEGERDEYHTILYVEPLNRRTEPALGFDMSTEPARRSAMQRAAETGRPAASGRVALIQEVDADQQAGFLMYVPVLQMPVSDATGAASTLMGFVYGAFRVTELMSEVLGPGAALDVAVFDGEAADVAALLHGQAPRANARGADTFSTRIDVAGRPWTMTVQPHADTTMPTEARLVPWVVVGGTMVSLLLFGLSRAQARAQATAEGVLDDLRASEDHLKESEGRYRFLFDGNPQPLWVYDTHTYEFLTVNAAAVRAYGYSREEFLRMRILDIRPAEDAPRLKARVAELGPGLGMSSAWRHRTKDGRIIDVDIVSHPLDFQGRSARIVSAIDITARKRAEDESRQTQQVLEHRVQERTQALQQSQHELAESQRELRDYVDHMSTLNAKISPDGRLLLVNRVAQAATGLPLERLLQTGFLDFEWFRFDPAVHARVTEAFERAAGGEATNYDEQLKIFDSTVYVNFSLTPVFDEQRRLQYILAEARDISAQKRAEQALRESSARLEAANRELEAFSSSVSHDLRTPLTSIDGFGSALLVDCGHLLNDDGRRHLDRIRAATQRMGYLIDDLLALSRVSRADLKREVVDLTALATVISDQLEQTHAGRRIETRITPGILTIGDARLLRIALENLLANAFKFTSRREHALIEFDATSVNGEIVYAVRDNGAGFDMRYASKLFGAFQRLHNSRDFRGTGIGLATVQRIIERHGGRIWAEAEVDRGATFSFTLPAA